MIAGRIMSFAGLRYYQNTTDPERAKFMSDMQDKITNLHHAAGVLQRSNSTGSTTTARRR
jgi:oligoendopeptidase F